MQTYLLITGVWLVMAVATAIAYARLAAFGARADAHLGEPSPSMGRRGSWAFPLQVATPLALACAAAAFLGDFGLPQATGRSIDAIQDSRAPAVQLAHVPAERLARRSRPRRGSGGRPAAAHARVGIDVAPGFAPGPSATVRSGAGTPVTPATKPVSTISGTRRPQRTRGPRRPGPGPSAPRPTASSESTPSQTPTAMAASRRPAAPSPMPDATPATPASHPEPTPPAAPQPSAKKGKPQRGSGPQPHAPAIGRRAQ